MNKVNVLVKQHISFEIYNSVDLSLLNKSLKEIAPLYPNFNAWLNFKFRRNLCSGERNIVLATDGDNVLGLSLLKTNKDENKICTFYVPKQYRCMNIGNELMIKSLSILDNQSSFITVADERHSELKPFLLSHDFKLEKSVDSLYRDNIKEHFYSL
ncbi:MULTISPECIES: GNAT family N-acetyltransferase [unclassified Colwellia]|uniref:GNAT family N-acetyltransferase n=1 Tax=unclassified Colwellia TaxID=196834 RepID=UPI0015F4B6F8|nr:MULTISPECIES: GNAT family N-acetyltransferase [unclassified Colwellia]MBA6232187.1 GNAT family N-acetyltransferase [Colwellia sp. MB02u-7]MBA6237115.1 GNAT family N-acetyltransferase [Colwellia sp. MB02u-11]MBA6301621.1 GNAT family N-acetyltransferase [Colwellia sp. MB3u-22]MBA6311507.1 GNAT family N-acetyltransferase [Colwellia sp. MB3u-64]